MWNNFLSAQLSQKHVARICSPIWKCYC